jgi:hypothetical protein
MPTTASIRDQDVDVDTIPPEVFLDAYPDHIRSAALDLRRLVLSAVPDAHEGVRTGWRLIGYAVPVGPRTRFFAGIGPEPRHCHLFFEYGVFLPDPKGQLEGANLRLKRVRYLTFSSRDDVAAIGEDVIREYVVRAAGLAAMTREQRLAMSLEHETA